ncbi:ATP-binding protein [Rapidithrix thailandica]|uniref:histidine kinase n=1 Tax=Rapidithrix thailandica TaxID=413964 RepID=A0AAW9SH35_9BACT
MTFNHFRVQILWRILLLALTFGGCTYFTVSERYLWTGLCGIVSAIIVYNLIYYMESTNRKVAFFLESVESSDFTVKFSKDSQLGKSFRELNEAFNKVLEAFRLVRAEKEENLSYLNTVVQYVRVGLLSYDYDGKVELYNNAAIKLLETPYLRNIAELEKYHPTLLQILKKIQPGSNMLLRHSQKNEELQLSVTATELRLRGRAFKLVSLQNIQPELQQKEAEAWQNLAKVLRHEIMNSITPITSYIETLNEILEEELAKNNSPQLNSQTIQDITKALLTIEKRSKGLLHFVNAYRSFSNIPKPNFSTFKVKNLLERVAQLFKVEAQKSNITLTCKAHPFDLELTADLELIETVLINLLKNAIEVTHEAPTPQVKLIGGIGSHCEVFIQVSDNGPGIIPEALEKIFIPFYSTKKQGSGIGLSLSRQIMYLHNGKLTVNSDLMKRETVFTLHF